MAHDPHSEGAAQDRESAADLPGQGADDDRPLRKPVDLPKRATPSGLVRRQVSVQDLRRGQGAGDDGEGGGKDACDKGRDSEEPRVEPEAWAPLPAAPANSRRDLSDEPRLPHKPIGARRVSRPEQAADAGVTTGSRSERLRRKARGPEGEEAWTGSNTSLWFVLAGLACILVVGYFLAVSLNQADPAPLPEVPPRTAAKETIDEIPIAEFVARADELLPIMAGLLDQAETSEGEALAKLVRGGAEAAARRARWRARGVEPARYQPVKNRQLHAAAVADMGYLVLVGLDADNLLAAAYFVKDGEEFKFDWEASEGYSEVLPSEVEGLKDDKPRLMRVVVSISAVSAFYTDQFPEERYRCYSFHHQEVDEFVWGYAELGSLTDRSLLASYRVPDLLGTERRATVTVRRGPEGARANQLEIVDFLHTDWISPD